MCNTENKIRTLTYLSNSIACKGVTISNQNGPKLCHNLELGIKNGIVDAATPPCHVKRKKK